MIGMTTISGDNSNGSMITGAPIEMTLHHTPFVPVRMGVVGLGNFGSLHASTLAGLAEAELVALVDRREDRLHAISGQFPDVGGWTDLDRAIAESEAEAWVVASSTASHVPLTKKLLDAGHTVLLEKPIAESLADAQSLAPLVDTDSSNLMLGHLILFNSEFRQLTDEVAQRGPIHYIDCVRHRPTETLVNFPGETPFHLTMVHDLYLVLVLAGRDEPIGFSAQTHRTPDGACDLALAQLQWPDGRLASLAASFLTPESMANDGFDRMEVFGAGWTARIRANPRPFEIWDEQARWPLTLELRSEGTAPSGMLAEELRCFCRVVRGQQAVPMGATYHDAMQVQGWIDRLEDCVTNPGPAR